ncbi:hypothetical protein PS6_011604 [Mucor atramentarius]
MASTRSSSASTASGLRMPRNAEISKEIRATYREHQRENNGVGVIITFDTPNAADLNDDLKKMLALTSERMEAPATNSQQGSNMLGRVVQHNRATRRGASEHVKYQKAKAREALLPAEVVLLAKKHRRKLNSRRNMKRDRRHFTFLADSPNYMRSINDSRVSFDAINKILKASELINDKDDDEGASPSSDHRAPRQRPGYCSDAVCYIEFDNDNCIEILIFFDCQLNGLCDLLDNDLPAQGKKGKLQHKIAATVISDVDPPKNFKQKYNQWAFNIEALSAAERGDSSVA